MKIKNLFAMLALVCGTAFVSSCSNDDNNNQDGPVPTPEQYDLAFSCSGYNSIGNPLLCDVSENETKLKELFVAKIDEAAGAKGGIVTVTPDTAGDVKEKVKQALIDYAAELEGSHKYIGKYEFKFACNTVDFVTVNMNTADEFAFITFLHKIKTDLEELSVEDLQNIHNNLISFSQIITCDLKPFPGFEKEYKDATQKISCVSAYGDVIGSVEQDITKDLNFLKYNKQTCITNEKRFYVNGGQHTASFYYNFMNYKKDFNFTIIEEPKAEIHVNNNEDAYVAVFTTGYPFNPSDFTKEFNVNVKLIRIDGDNEETIRSLDEKITLVTDTSRDKVAATKMLEICKIDELKSSCVYKVVITSDWEPANNVTDYIVFKK